VFQKFTTELREIADAAGEAEPPWYDVGAHRARHRAGDTTAAERGPFIVISRLPGAGGSEIAERVAAELGWPVLDKQLLGRMAERFHVDPDLLEMIDETASNFLHDAFGHLLIRDFVSQNAYVAYLRKTVRDLAEEGPAVFVGRGCQYFLPRHRSLLARIVADDCDRITQFEQQYHVKPALAEKIVQQTTKQHAAFVKRYFHHNLNDASAYDLVVHSSRLGVEGCKEVIVAALHCSGLLQPADAKATS
jgi:cytidylate kinase